MADRNDEAPKNAERKNFDDLSHLNASDGEAVRQSAEQPPKAIASGKLFGGTVDCHLPSLEAAGLVAPILRNADERTLRRQVKVYDRDTGEVVREATVREVVGGLAKATALGLEVVEGVRPKEVACTGCAAPIRVPPRGAHKTLCKRCESGGQRVCAGGCGRAPGRSAFWPSSLRLRDGGPWLCKACRNIERGAAKAAARASALPGSCS